MLATTEHKRLSQHRLRQANWRHWGPYLSERAWGTVREDYSASGTAWDYFPHDHARSRAYRWNEDGLAGISDRNQYLCFAWSLWNGQDAILKERLFGLSGPEGNHGEDVKEYYFYLDNTPTHSYMWMRYKYPQAAFPYQDLVATNAQRGYHEPEYELLDTGVFDQDRYFDLDFYYAKADQDDLLIQVRITNRGDQSAPYYLLPTLWFRNTWSWGYPQGPMGEVPTRPRLNLQSTGIIRAEHVRLGTYYLYSAEPVQALFTENETNYQRLFNVPSPQPYVKDAFHRYLIDHEKSAVNPKLIGSKAAWLFQGQLEAGQSRTYQLRLSNQAHERPFADFDNLVHTRQQEAERFYASIQPASLNQEEQRVQRQAFAGLLWTKQLYYYDVEQWLAGDPAVQPPAARRHGRNSHWKHLVNFDVISMPDKWEYPWYATWDLAFHCLPLALIDPDYAKRQLVLLTRVWYMHPNGQLPAYEWAFEDVNPPVHAWAAWRVYKIDARQTGRPDRAFLEGIFHALLLNFTWWTNRKDEDENNIFEGGFLGLDNISVFDRSAGLPIDGRLDQADGTAWMAAYCLNMLKIALELANEDPIYQDIATKFFEHFLRIAYAMSHLGDEDYSLWDDEDQFFYDALHEAGGRTIPLKVRSLVGLLPLFAVETLEPDLLQAMPDFQRRLHWFVDNRPHLSGNMASVDQPGVGERRLLSILTPERLRAVLARMLDEEEFLSPYGIRSLSKKHQEQPFVVEFGGQTHTVTYWPAESQSSLFGGNSNWRGPVWFPINYLIIESLQKYHHYYGPDFKVEFPTGSGEKLSLDQVANELSRRLVRLFLPDQDGQRPVYKQKETFQRDPHWKDLILFYEYFHGEDGSGLGASHQTGWTGLVAKLIQQSGEVND